ncbi:SAVMC3_10250 family protein [Streptomyces sp. NPDC004610]|uniref:DUF7019 family protein n=1 Tax=unclassified Streptomyces TaxID=2593676 RepID=UPI0033A837B8
MSVRYYLYISDAKVDMLLAQIDPAFGGRRTTEAGMSVKFLSFRRSVEAAVPDRVARLERVLAHLREHEPMGTADQPGPYFSDSLPMQWGPLRGGNGAGSVYFGGRTPRTIVGLGGAGAHVIGGSAPQETVFAPSSTPALIDGLAATFAADGVEAPTDPSALAWVHSAGRVLRGPAQSVEFVARRLVEGASPYPEADPHPHMRVLLGSPLYVALTD